MIHNFSFICSKQIFKTSLKRSYVWRLAWMSMGIGKNVIFWKPGHCVVWTDNRWRWCCINTFLTLSLLLYLNLKTCSFYSWYQFIKGLLFKHKLSKKLIQFDFDNFCLQFYLFISNDLLVLRWIIPWMINIKNLALESQLYNIWQLSTSISKHKYITLWLCCTSL